jgi:glycosyltransferase involved in cell wall biosynthesis
MKILFCLHHFLPDYIAGTEIYTYNLAKKLQELDIEVVVVIPNFGFNETIEYYYENIRVIKYAENSIEDRKMILGNRKPDGLQVFLSILKKEKPSIIHFQELITGRGINLFHVEVAYKLNFKIILTAHLSYYTCQTGNLVYKGKELTDGKIEINKCTACTFHDKGVKGLKAFTLKPIAMLLYHIGWNSLSWNSKLGTALGIPFLIEKKRKDLTLLAEMCDKIVSITSFYPNILKLNEVPENKLTIIKQGLPGDIIYERNKQETFREPLKIIFIGRISEFKGIHLLLRAIKELGNEKITLDIYGEIINDDYTNYCRQISSNLIGVEWKDIINAQEKSKRLPQYDLLCLPSTFSEMSPLVIQEAFAAGIPVLASDVYGNAEQIKDGVNGWLFKFKDVEDVKRKLLALIREPALIQKARQNLAEIRSFSVVALEYRKLYREVLNNENNV